jgi:hypothetical protein
MKVSPLSFEATSRHPFGEISTAVIFCLLSIAKVCDLLLEKKIENKLIHQLFF